MKEREKKGEGRMTNLLTRKAGSVTICGPTRMSVTRNRATQSVSTLFPASSGRSAQHSRPCSTKVTASLTVSAIFILTITIGNLLLQNALTVTFSHCDKVRSTVKMPML